jgi:4-hydroxy-2-oxoheptanedioate aldolase
LLCEASEFSPRDVVLGPKIVEKTLRGGIAVGTFVDSFDSAQRWLNAGVRFVAYSLDTGIFYDACSEIVKTIRSYRPS